MKKLDELLKNYREMGFLKKAVIMVLAVAAAILLGSVFVLMSGADPVDAYYYMMVKPLSSINSLGEVFIYFTYLSSTSLWLNRVGGNSSD